MSRIAVSLHPQGCDVKVPVPRPYDHVVWPQGEEVEACKALTAMLTDKAFVDGRLPHELTPVSQRIAEIVAKNLRAIWPMTCVVILPEGVHGVFRAHLNTELQAKGLVPVYPKMRWAQALKSPERARPTAPRRTAEERAMRH